MVTTEIETAPDSKAQTANWLKTACILCSENCGIEVQVENGHITKVRGDKAHPASRGYLCQKASRLDYYQNNTDRLNSPLRRRADGTFEEISWDDAISEIAEKLVQLRDTHGGHSLAYYGGGGQGNHLGGVYGSALRSAMKTRYIYTSLAQEKTGGFWVNGKLFGRQTCHPTNDIENSNYVLFIGTNPWQSHGFARARKVLQAIRKDPDRKMVVIDPRRTKTAEMADVHLAVRPGMDAFLLSAMLGVIFQESLEDKEFLDAHAVGVEEIRERFAKVPVDDYAKKSGIDPEQLRTVTREFAAAPSATIRADLGLEQTLHSTLNSYLEKLLFLVTGNFGKVGANNLHTQFVPLIGHSGDPATDEKVWKTRATGVPEISKIFPPNVLPAEINNDREDRIRGLVVDSSNPMITAADTQAYREAFEKLELLVVIDVAMSDTADLADYVLPASSQYEKYEATFFTLSFPTNHFHLRHPLFEPREGTLPEPEIYRRLAIAMGADAQSLPILGSAAQFDALLPERKDSAPENLKAVSGPLFMASQMYAQKNSEALEREGLKDEGKGLGAALFMEILDGKSGVELGRNVYEDTFELIRHPDKKIHLAVAEMSQELDDLGQELSQVGTGEEGYPLVLSAGERRSYNANTIYRDPKWRRDDPDGALHIHPDDAAQYGLADGEHAICESRRGSVVVRVEVTDSAQPGFVILPHGYGMNYTDEDTKERRRTGPLINLLSSAERCDPIAKTPYHKYIPVRVKPGAE